VRLPTVQLPAMLPGEASEAQLVQTLDEIRQVLAVAMPPAILRQRVREFGGLKKWGGRLDRAAFSEGLELALAEEGYPYAVVQLALQKLVKEWHHKEDEWMPSIGWVLKTCRSVRKEWRDAIRTLEDQLAVQIGQRQAQARQVEREMLALLDDETAAALGFAEFCAGRPHRLRLSIERLKDELAEKEAEYRSKEAAALAHLQEQPLFRYYAEDKLAQWRANAPRPLEALRAEIAEKEAELKAVEQREADKQQALDQALGQRAIAGESDSTAKKRLGRTRRIAHHKPAPNGSGDAAVTKSQVIENIGDVTEARTSDTNIGGGLCETPAVTPAVGERESPVTKSQVIENIGDVTESRGDVTKIGRPSLGTGALTAAERKARQRHKIAEKSMTSDVPACHPVGGPEGNSDKQTTKL